MADDDGRLFAPGRRPLTVGIVLTVTAVAFEALAIATALPAAATELRGVRLYGWAFSAFTLAHLVSTVVAGPHVDRRGPAGPFVVGLGLFSAGLVLGGTAPSMVVLVTGRVVQGLGSGAVSSVANVSVGRGYPPAARPRMLAVMSSAWVVPGLVGPAIAGAVADAMSWRAVFLGLLPVLAVAGALTVPALRRLPPDEAAAATGATPSRWRDALRVSTGAGLALGGLGAHSVVLPAVLVPAGIAIAARPLARLLPSGALRGAGGVAAAVSIRGLMTFGFFGAEAFLVLTLHSVRGVSLAHSGLVLTAGALSWTAAAWVCARVAPRLGWRRTERIGIALIATGVALVGSLLAGAPVVVGPVAWAVGGFGMGLAYPTGTLIVLEEAAAGEEGAAISSLSMSDVLGVALGTGVGGAAVSLAIASGWGRRPGIALADACCFAALTLAFVLARGLPDRHDRPSSDAFGRVAPESI